MRIDVIDIHSFYSSPIGVAAGQSLGLQIRAVWPDLRGLSLLGLGFATPYLAQFQGDAERVIGMMPAAQGVMRWPPGAASLTALVDEDDLPLPDASIDRILLVHGLETSEHVRNSLREIWRVLAPGGKVLVVVPNRIGLWARLEATPFGHGRPYSRSQITHLLRDSLFSPEHWSSGLYMPPIERLLLLRPAQTWERIGRILWRRFAGVLIVEATKQIYAPVQQPALNRRAAKTTLAPQAGLPIVGSGSSN